MNITFSIMSEKVRNVSQVSLIFTGAIFWIDTKLKLKFKKLLASVTNTYVLKSLENTLETSFEMLTCYKASFYHRTITRTKITCKKIPL